MDDLSLILQHIPQFASATAPEIKELTGGITNKNYKIAEDANESFLSRRLRNLKKTAPDIADVALAALAGPGSAISTSVKKVAKKLKSEAE